MIAALPVDITAQIHARIAPTLPTWVRPFFHLASDLNLIAFIEMVRKLGSAPDEQRAETAPPEFV